MAGPVEIVCDESGYEGDRLVGSTTALFAHASVLISEAEAATILAELRARIRSPATQYKANHLLRPRHRAVLEWFLGPDAPLRGRASVFVVDKTHYVLARVVELLLGDGPLAPGGAALRPETELLHRYVTRASASIVERRLPEVANDLLRRRGSADQFFTVVTEIRGGLAAPQAARRPRDTAGSALPTPNGPRAIAPLPPEAVNAPREGVRSGPLAANGPPPSGVDDLLGWLAGAGARAAEYRAALAADPEAAGASVDPLTPAILAAVRRWDAGHGVTVAHDRQIALSSTRVARLRTWSDGRLAAVRFLVAEDEPRIQLADILAGTVRALLSSGDATARPFVDPASLLPHAGHHDVADLTGP
ncbi:hypothetical protein ACIA8K_06215 [Catenuloplanes sp. NPDC051500]|uniref:hypothetical protein n=1 Tax=Catenuloplanes sp. NPDC051500 TaxID=3363959 RepID=UPI00378DAF00